jgi:WG containing repeat
MRLLTISVILLATALLTVSLSDACNIAVPIWSLTSKSADPLFRFVANGKTGYIDRSGKIVISPARVFSSPYNSGGEFREGLVAVSAPGTDGGYRYVNRLGKVLFTSPNPSGFFEGLLASKEGGAWGYVDHSGNFAIKPEYYTASPFSDGLAEISTSGELGHTGFIDRSGNIAVSASLTWANDFHEGFAAAIPDGLCKIVQEDSCGFLTVFGPKLPGANYECRRTFIDKTGKPISNLRFDDTGEFSEGLAAVKIGNQWGYIDKTGRIAIQPQFGWAYRFSEGLAVVRRGDKSGYIDHSGNYVVQPSFTLSWAFSEHRAIVMDQDRNGQPTYRFIDPSGRPAFPGTFDFATPFVHGLAAVSSKMRGGKGLVSYIDTSGKSAFTYRADPNVLGR